MTSLAARTADGTAQRRPRDPWWDNAKMALVTLVVVGHTWTLLPEGPMQLPYDFLYSWHVPAFVLVTGYLSRGFAWTRPRLVSLVTTVAVPYVVFETLMSLFRIGVGGEHLEGIFADPHWPMWYLAALFLWRLATPVLKRHVVAVPLTVVVSMLAGAFAGDTLDLARVLGLLPFFTIGLHATPDRLELLRRPRARTAAVVVMLGLLVLAHWTDAWINTEWLYYRARYDELPGSDLRDMATRLALLGIGTSGALAFLALVPRTSGWFTRMGAWTLVVYLYHGFAVKAAEFAGFEGWAQGHAVVAVTSATVAAVALALLLATEPVGRRLSVLVDPYGHALRAARGRPTATG